MYARLTCTYFISPCDRLSLQLYHVSIIIVQHTYRSCLEIFSSVVSIYKLQSQNKMLNYVI